LAPIQTPIIRSTNKIKTWLLHFWDWTCLKYCPVIWYSCVGQLLWLGKMMVNCALYFLYSRFKIDTLKFIFWWWAGCCVQMWIYQFTTYIMGSLFSIYITVFIGLVQIKCILAIRFYWWKPWWFVIHSLIGLFRFSLKECLYLWNSVYIITPGC
jgi:hypothetical protein